MLKYFNRDLERHSINNLHNADNQKEVDPANEIPSIQRPFNLFTYSRRNQSINSWRQSWWIFIE